MACLRHATDMNAYDIDTEMVVLTGLIKKYLSMLRNVHKHVCNARKHALGMSCAGN
jgi:hypothetical protein